MPVNRAVNRVRRSLKLSVLDGACFSAMLGLTQAYVTPLALALKATTQQVGLLASIPTFATAVSQLAAPAISDTAGSRKKLILPIVFMHAILWLPILLVPYLMVTGRIWWLIAFVTLSAILGLFAGPAWGSLMADLVPAHMRGRYFAFRARISVLTMLVFGLIAGGILQIFQNISKQSGETLFTGFAVIFGGALIFRLLSVYFLLGMYEPRQSGSSKRGQSLFYLLTHLGTSNLGRFILFVALIGFGANIAAPFFSVYELRDLKFNYATYMIISLCNALAQFAFQAFWGRRADRAGNVMLLKVASSLIPFVPLIWMLNKNPFYLMGAEVFSGLAWSGFNLAASNFIYDASEPENRTKQLAILNAFNMLGGALGAVVGGYITPHLPSFLGYNLRSLMLISGLARGLVVLIFVRSIVEVRHVPKISLKQFILGN